MAYLDQIKSWPPAEDNLEMALLTALTQGYLLLSELVSKEQDVRTGTMHAGQEFDVNEYQRLDRGYFSPVIRLVHFIRQQMAPYLSSAFIHGSMGDLRYAKGYSDLDTWLVLDEATVTNATRLRQFAKKCYRSLTDVYRFDPLQHHGHMIATAIDWRWYSENWLPLEAFKYARRLIPDKPGLQIHLRDSALDARHSFEELQELMHLRYAQRWLPRTAFELKDYLSILMLAPALFLQAKGSYVAKQDSFQLACDRLPNANWDAMRYATQARSSWPYYRSHFMELVRPPNVFWANMLQRRPAQKAYQSMLESFPAACLSHAADLTQQMADDVEQSTARFHALKQVRDEADLPLFIVNHPLVHEAHDYEETRERYIATAQQPAVLAMYQYGNITYPGLSDLDLMLCISETVEPIAATRLAVEALGPLDQSVMLHSPMIVPASQITFIHEFLIDTTLEKIWGAQDPLAGVQAISGLTKAYVQTARLFEMLYSYRVWIGEVLIQQTLDARWAIPSLKSILYSCNTLESVSGNTLTWAADFRAAIQELRANWFLEESQSRQNAALRAVFRLGVDVILRMTGELDNFVQHSGWLTDPGAWASAAVTLPSLNAAITFGGQPMSDAQQVIEHPGQINFPKTFWKFLNIYFQAFNNSEDRNQTSTAQTEFESYLLERIKKINQHMRFLQRHHMNYGGYLPGQLEQLLSNTRR